MFSMRNKRKLSLSYIQYPLMFGALFVLLNSLFPELIYCLTTIILMMKSFCYNSLKSKKL